MSTALPKVSTKARRLLHRFAMAQTDKDDIGGKDPEDWPEILREYEEAKLALWMYVSELEGRKCAST